MTRLQLHLSGHGPQNGLVFKGEVYELLASPQSHLAAEREGWVPRESWLEATHGQPFRTPIPGPRLRGHSSSLDHPKTLPPPMALTQPPNPTPSQVRSDTLAQSLRPASAHPTAAHPHSHVQEAPGPSVLPGCLSTAGHLCPTDILPAL